MVHMAYHMLFLSRPYWASGVDRGYHRFSMIAGSFGRLCKTGIRVRTEHSGIKPKRSRDCSGDGSPVWGTFRLPISWRISSPGDSARRRSQNRLRQSCRVRCELRRDTLDRAYPRVWNGRVEEPPSVITRVGKNAGSSRDEEGYGDFEISRGARREAEYDLEKWR